MKSEQWLYLMNMVVSRMIQSGKSGKIFEPEKILCVKWDEIGDMAACVHVFALLKKRFPKAEINVLTKKYSAEIISNDPHISKIFTEEKGAVWKEKYSLIIELRGTWYTLWNSILQWPRWRLDRGLIRYKHRGNQLHETETNYEIIAPILGEIENQKGVIYSGESAISTVEKYLQDKNIAHFAVMHVGARKALRRWPAERFAYIADYLFSEYQIHTILVGSDDEIPQMKEVEKNAKGGSVLLFSPGNTLLEMAALMQRSKLFIGNESGPLQIADLCKIPVIGLFGPGVKEVFYPRAEKKVVLHHILECNPCDQVHCKYPENTCMERINAIDVKLAVDQLLRV